MKRYAGIFAALLLLTLVGCDSKSAGSSSVSVSVVSSAPSAPDATGGSSVPPMSVSIQAASEPLPENRQPATGVEEEYLTGLGDLSGSVLGLNPDGFSFTGGAPRVSADGSYAAGGNDIASLDVVYTENTIFLLCEYEMATQKGEVFAATEADVVQGRGVTIWGEYEGDYYVAGAVRVFVPI